MCANPDPSDVAFEKILALIPGFKRPKSRGNRPFGIYAPPRFGDREIEARRFRNIANGKGLYYFYLVATVLASKKSQGRFHASLKHQYTNWLHAPYDNWTYPFTDKQIAVLDTFENQKAFKALTGLAPGAAWHVSHKKNAMPIGSPKLDSWIKPAPAKILNQGSAGESNTNLAKPPARTQQRGVSSSPDYITIKCLQRENRRVAIINGMVTQLYRREIMFQDHPSVYYLAQITGGYASCELKVRLLAYPVKATKARLTENAVKSHNISVGSTISFSGLTRTDAYDGLVFIDIRTVRTGTMRKSATSIATDQQVKDLFDKWSSIIQSLPATKPRAPARSELKYLPPSSSDLSSMARSAENVFELMSVRMRKKLERARLMEGGRSSLYIKCGKEYACAVVESQSQPGRLEYATYLDSQGHYYCCSQDLQECLGMQGNLCKHIILLIIAVSKGSSIPAFQLKEWVVKAVKQRPLRNEDLATMTFMQYKLKDEKSIEWRTVEILPEDLAAF